MKLPNPFTWLELENREAKELAVDVEVLPESAVELEVVLVPNTESVDWLVGANSALAPPPPPPPWW